MKFVGRHSELMELDRLWESHRAEFLILYGRRRIGKTALLLQWMKSKPVKALYWVATPDSPYAQLRSFSQAIYGFSRPESPVPETFTYASWEQAWDEVVRISQTERVALILDEFTYLLETTPAIAAKLQHFWDQKLKESNLLLVISGSHLGMMIREVLAYQAPLYGRATSRIHLKEIPFGCTSDYFTGYSAEERVAIYSMFGGVPAYWERINTGISISKNIRTQLLSTNNLMQAEPRLLLQDFIKEPNNYLSILTAIAHNARTPKEISTYTGLPNMHIPKYLGVLTDAGFVERKVSVTASPDSRQGRHHICDPYLRFYFRFLAERQSQLAMGIQDQVLAEITQHLIEFIGMHTWEEICREWTLRASTLGKLPVKMDQVGSAWNRTVQVDVAGIDHAHKTMILGECKWSNTPTDSDVLMNLVEEKCTRVIPQSDHWKVYLIGYSRKGWTDSARIYCKNMQGSLRNGQNWQVSGMKLVDLQQVDEDLKTWSA